MYNKTWITVLPMMLAASLLSAALEPGDTMPGFSVMDQHEVAYALQPGVRYLLVSFDMSTGKSANKYLEEQGEAYLPNHGAVYLSNIHGMPWVGRKFALPKMRKYPHRILLADEPEEALLQQFPQKEDHVTVFQLDPGLKIVSIQFWDPKSGSNPLGG